jgi:DNA-binding MurR/RpiR family transcriptional regulator
LNGQLRCGAPAQSRKCKSPFGGGGFFYGEKIFSEKSKSKLFSIDILCGIKGVTFLKDFMHHIKNMKDFILQKRVGDVRMSFDQLVKESFAQLSPGQKKVAEYLLQNIEKVAFSTAVQIGREADVSETTVIRFAYALGFGGFSEMQAAIQQHVLQTNTARLADSSPPSGEEQNLFARVIERDIAILRQTLHQLNEQDVWTAVDWLLQADRVLVVGYRASYAAAHWFSFMLRMIRPDVLLLPFSGETEERIVSLTERSVVLIISFPRYTRQSVRVAEACKRMGARLIAATDRLLSPVGRLSDLVFITDINIESGQYSNASVINLLNLLFAAITVKTDTRPQKRMKQLEQLYSSWDVFVE